MNEKNAPELERLYNRLLIQSPGAFLCVLTNPPTLQREIVDELINHLPEGEARVIDFSDIEQVGLDYIYSTASLGRMAGDGIRILFLMNFHLAGGKLSDLDFIQIINLSRACGNAVCVCFYDAFVFPCADCAKSS